jgi:hypothetical protein
MRQRPTCSNAALTGAIKFPEAGQAEAEAAKSN